MILEGKILKFWIFWKKSWSWLSNLHCKNEDDWIFYRIFLPKDSVFKALPSCMLYFSNITCNFVVCSEFHHELVHMYLSYSLSLSSIPIKWHYATGKHQLIYIFCKIVWFSPPVPFIFFFKLFNYYSTGFSQIHCLIHFTQAMNISFRWIGHNFIISPFWAPIFHNFSTL